MVRFLLKKKKIIKTSVGWFCFGRFFVVHNATSAGPWRCNLVGAVHSLCAQQYQSHFIKLIDRLVVGYESILCQKCSNKYKHSPTCSSRHTFNATFRTFFPPDLKKKKKERKKILYRLGLAQN